MKRIIFTVVTIALLSGCATSPEAPSFVKAPIPESASEKAVLYIYRENAQPTAWSAYLQIDDQDAASLSQQGFTWVYVTPGNHKFKYGWPIIAGMPSVKFERSFESGKVYAFEMKGDISGASVMTATSAIQPTDISSAKQQMLSCCRYVAPKAATF
jgi:hypothetical protein